MKFVATCCARCFCAAGQTIGGRAKGRPYERPGLPTAAQLLTIHWSLATGHFPSVLIRSYTPADLDALRAMHAAQGFAYPFPDLANPLFLTKLVLEDDAAFALVGAPLGAPPRVSQGKQAGAASSAPTDLYHEGSADFPISNCDPSAHPVMAVLLRLTCEAYLLHDPAAGSPRQRWQWLLAMHEAVRAEAYARGLDDVHAFLPPRVERTFGRRLRRLGWVKDPWASFCRRV